MWIQKRQKSCVSLDKHQCDVAIIHGLLSTAENIKKFLTYYRREFPSATVTPKLHMLEEHIVLWVTKWKVGFGHLGEQGAESIHASFNSLKRTYSLLRLKQIMVEHHLRVAPDNTTARPPVQKRARRAVAEAED